MALTDDEAVVLRRLDYSETSQVLVFFAHAGGKVRAIAKGIKRSSKTRFGAAIDLLDVGHVVYSVRSPRQSTLAVLTEWKQTRSLTGLRQRLDRLYAAQYAAEVVAGLTEDWDPHPVLYERLVGLLDELCDGDGPVGSVVDFQRALLHETGSLPDFDRCVSCGRCPGSNESVLFSSFEGGLICRDCEGGRVEKRHIGPSALAIVRGAPEGQGAGLEAFETFNYHIAHLMGREPALAARVRTVRS